MSTSKKKCKAESDKIPMRKQFRSEDLARQGQPKPCPECPDYKTCRTPCEEVERWISQDHVGLNTRTTLLQGKDITPSPYFEGAGLSLPNDFLDIASERNKESAVKPDKELAKVSWDIILMLNLPKTSLEFATLYYHNGKRLVDTARELKISAQAANDRHKKLKRDVKERLQRLEIWNEIKGNLFRKKNGTKKIVLLMYYGEFKSAREIADEMGISYKYTAATIGKFKRKILDKSTMVETDVNSES